MIVGIGTDIVDITRIEKILGRFGTDFREKILTPAERERTSPAYVAKRFAAKEAVSKALGTGISKLGWQSIEVFNEDTGRPRIKLYSLAAERLAQLIPAGYSFEIHVSLSDERGHAIAFVVIEARKSE